MDGCYHQITMLKIAFSLIWLNSNVSKASVWSFPVKFLLVKSPSLLSPLSLQCRTDHAYDEREKRQLLEKYLTDEYSECRREMKYLLKCKGAKFGRCEVSLVIPAGILDVYTCMRYTARLLIRFGNVKLPRKIKCLDRRIKQIEKR